MNQINFSKYRNKLGLHCCENMDQLIYCFTSVSLYLVWGSNQCSWRYMGDAQTYGLDALTD